jgi:glycosyltransferase involved in cell wall biosynthesis
MADGASMRSAANVHAAPRGPLARALLARLTRAPQRLLERWLWPSGPPAERWHSWDATPWNHPWLTPENIRAMRDYSERVLARLAEYRRTLARPAPSIGFVGNIANNLFIRAAPLRKAGYAVHMYLHPHDRYVMSRPGWEDFDGSLPDDVRTLDDLARAGLTLPEPADVHTLQTTSEWVHLQVENLPAFSRPRDFLRWQNYFAYLPGLQALQQHDVLLAVQAPYLAYLSARPYAVTQSGGDIWLECSRDDAFGRLQRTAFAKASVFLVTNPWSYAHARRYGFHHLIYLPLMMDQHAYSPGDSPAREEWRRAVGGEFFALMTSRLDDRVKGSMGIEGFARFAAVCPQARLVLMSWGVESARLQERLAALGIQDKSLVLPLAGKRRLVSYLRAADCVIDQFILGYFGASALEAFACGLPVIMRLEREQYEAMCRTGAPPVLDADSATAVAGQLKRLAEDPGWRSETGQRSRRWFVENHGSVFLRERYMDVLVAVAAGKRAGFMRSPLRVPLTAAEREYHAAQLLAAPQFPLYQ